MLGPRGLAHLTIFGRLAVREMSLLSVRDSLLWLPGVILWKKGQVHQGRAALPLTGGKEGRGLQAAHPPRGTHSPF